MTEQEIRARLSSDDLSIFEQSVLRLIDNQAAEIAELRALAAAPTAPQAPGCDLDAVLEQAARICDETFVEPGDMKTESCHEAAAKIRALKGQKPQSTGSWADDEARLDNVTVGQHTTPLKSEP